MAEIDYITLLMRRGELLATKFLDVLTHKSVPAADFFSASAQLLAVAFVAYDKAHPGEFTRAQLHLLVDMAVDSKMPLSTEAGS